MFYSIKKKSIITVVAIAVLVAICITGMANREVSAVFNNQSLERRSVLLLRIAGTGHRKLPT